MNDHPTRDKIQELMEEAFMEGPEAPVYAELQKVLKENPEYLPLWEEFLSVRKAMGILEANSQPLELVTARVRQSARKNLEAGQGGAKKTKISKGWRFLLSQPVVAAATVAVIVGVGIYSQFWLKEQPGDLSQPRPLVDGMITREPPPPEVESKKLDSFKDERLRIQKSKAKEIARPRSLSEEAAPPPAKFAPKTSAPSGLLKGEGLGGGVMEAEKPQPVQALDQKPQPKKMEKRDTLQLAPQAPVPALPEGGRKAEPAVSAPVPATRSKMQYSTPKGRTGYEKATESDAAIDQAAPTEKTPDPHWTKLITQAKTKMKAKDYPGALQDLLEAQKINDSEEVRKLIAKCREKIRLVKEKPTP